MLLPLWRIRRKLAFLTSRARIAWWRRREQASRSKWPGHLANFERQIFSQNGEDGIVEEIFRRIGTVSKYFVEFGVEDGTQCNCRCLLENGGWRGLWIEGSPSLADSARVRFKERPVTVAREFITCQNINSILEAAGAPGEPDLLSVDVDGNDYWLWKEIATRFNPRVAIVEYNASLTPGKDWVMPYDPEHRWDGSSYFGASLSALEKLGRALGYTLVCCDSAGVNSFFVRDDLVLDRFVGAGQGAEFHYVSPKYNGLGFGHPPRVSPASSRAAQAGPSTKASPPRS